MDTLDSGRVRRFFSRITQGYPDAPSVTSIVVTHLLPDRPYLVHSIQKITTLAALLPKPKTADPRVVGWLQHRVPIASLSRDLFENKERAIAFLIDRVQDSRFMLVDIGGYFASSLTDICGHFGSQLIGVVEDTENGVQKYEKIGEVEVPIIHVARSPLKNPEDYLVGQSIVYSTEALLREQSDILHGRTACVIGYGKLGRSIANLLHARHVRTVVFDTDPMKRIEALSHGFSVSGDIAQALRGSGLIFGATGNRSLVADNFPHIKSGAYIATVTSSEDELDLSALRDQYQFRLISDNVSEYRKDGHVFYVLNRGQAINFIHGAAVGPFIYLVHGEILLSMIRLMQGKVPNGLQENDGEARRFVANCWLEEFGQS